MPDYSDRKTENILKKLERKILREYSNASRDLTDQAEQYFEKFKERDKKYREGLKSGTIKPPAGQSIEQHYKEWRTAQIGRGKRWEALRNEMSRRVTESSKIAASYINDTTPSIYSINANYTAYTIEQVDKSAAFNLVDENTAKLLMTDEDASFIPKSKVSMLKDVAWNNKKLQNALTQGIIQGQSIEKIAKSFTNIAQMSARSAIRNARTSCTSAQNAGRMLTLRKASKMGIDVKKEWKSTHDARTRDSHAMLDGVRVEIEEKFPNGLIAPADQSGTPAEYYNCRCTLGYILPDINDEPISNNTVESYNKWLDAKRAAQKPTTHADATYRALEKKINAEKRKSNGIIKTNINIPKSVGAAGKNYPVKLPNGERTKLYEGTKITNIHVIAGNQTETELRDRFILESAYHINADEWQKCVGNGYVKVNGQKAAAELHWYEAEGERYEMKVKRYLDES